MFPYPANSLRGKRYGETARYRNPKQASLFEHFSRAATSGNGLLQPIHLLAPKMRSSSPEGGRATKMARHFSAPPQFSYRVHGRIVQRPPAPLRHQALFKTFATLLGRRR